MSQPDGAAATQANVMELGYLVFEVADVSGWQQFATEVLGMQEGAKFKDGSVSMRVDAHAHRLFLCEGEADDLVALGWQVADERALGAVTDALRESGADVESLSGEDAAARGSKGLVRSKDPSGIPLEFYVGPEMGPAFESPVLRSDFVTGEQGMGHLVARAEDQQASVAFYRDVLGFEITDFIDQELRPGLDLHAVFMRTNPRHHSIGFGNLPLPKNIQHFMVEYRDMDDVGLAHDRFVKAGLSISRSLGRHPNDRMYSFYGMTPSGFEVEVGWGGRKVPLDPDRTPPTYDSMSEWGHVWAVR